MISSPFRELRGPVPDRPETWLGAVRLTIQLRSECRRRGYHHWEAWRRITPTYRSRMCEHCHRLETSS